MDFLICYEHIVREIENDTLIKYELEKRGYSCKIIHFNDIDYCLHTKKEKAKVVVTPWLRYDNNVYHYLQYAKKPYKLVNLQWEQVYNEHGIKSGVVKTDGEALKACHLCWGENSSRRLISQGMKKENAPVLGAVQMDYGSSIFDDYYLSRDAIAEQYNLDKDRKWNLLISSFAYANYGDDNIALIEQKFNTSMAVRVELDRKSQSATLDWIERLLGESDCEFIYRPHPSENVDERLNSMVKQYPHFHVIGEKSVKQWAKVCDKTNLWISTSNAELLAMKVDYAIVRPFGVPYDYEIESMRNETFITSPGDFIRYNTSYEPASEAEIKAKLERISYYYSYDENYPAYKRIADYLENVLKSDEGQSFKFSIRNRFSFKVRAIKNFIISKLERKCYLADSTKPIEKLPIKAVIKSNVKMAIEKRKNKETLENRMTDYLRQHDKR